MASSHQRMWRVGFSVPAPEAELVLFLHEECSFQASPQQAFLLLHEVKSVWPPAPYPHLGPMPPSEDQKTRALIQGDELLRAGLHEVVDSAPMPVENLRGHPRPRFLGPPPEFEHALISSRGDEGVLPHPEESVQRAFVGVQLLPGLPALLGVIPPPRADSPRVISSQEFAGGKLQNDGGSLNRKHLLEYKALLGFGPSPHDKRTCLDDPGEQVA